MFRFKYEANSKVMDDKERLKLKHYIISTFRLNVLTLSKHYLEQKGNDII